MVSSLSLADFPFFADLSGTNSSISSAKLSVVLASKKLPGVCGDDDDDDDDGSKACSG